MNQADITRALAKAFGLAHADSRRILRSLLDQIARGLKEDKRVHLRGFGAFLRAGQAAKKFRHSKTGEILTRPARATVRFRPAPSLEKSVEISARPARGQTVLRSLAKREKVL